MLPSIVQFFSHHPFRKEIATVIIVKIIALIILWEVCFANISHEQLTQEKLTQHFTM